MKVIKVLLIVILSIIVIGFLVIKLYKPLGGRPTKKDKEDYAKRSEIFKDGKFVNPGNFTVMGEWKDPYSERKGTKGTKPVDKIPVIKYKYTEAKEDEVLITWFGHSSSLIQIGDFNILIDPVFGKVTSPVSFIGPKRYSDVPVSVKDLPKIDVVLISHDHYDHNDYRTLKELESKTKKYIVPLGIDKDLEKFGISKSKIQNMAWWEEVNIKDILIACTPSRHFSGRYLIDSNEALWSSWIIKNNKYTIFNSGDTGYDDHFKEIKERYSDIDFAMFDGSQYNEMWHKVHMFPEETVQAAIDVGAKVSMVEHYGAFVLSDHSWDDPVNRFTIEAKEKNIEYVTPLIGETFNLKEYKNYQNEWWKDIK